MHDFDKVIFGPKFHYYAIHYFGDVKLKTETAEIRYKFYRHHHKHTQLHHWKYWVNEYGHPTNMTKRWMVAMF